MMQRLWHWIVCLFVPPSVRARERAEARAWAESDEANRG